MRIGMMAPPWVPVPPAAYGGTESVVDRLARGLHAGGDEVFLWASGDSTCPVERGHVIDHADADRIGVATIEMRHVIRGYEAMVRWGADIVHDHTLIGPIYAGRPASLPVVTTNHGPFSDELIDLYRAIAEEVPVIAISHAQAATAADLPLAGVIHHGVDLDRFPFGDGTGDEHGPYFLYLGRMAPEKGAREAALAAREAGARLIIAAKRREPWEHRFFGEQIEPLLGPDVVYVGEADHATKVRLLRGATALLNPISWPEPFGLVMIEALACGTPVLALPYGSVPEIIDDGVTGFVCDDVDDLTEHLGKAGDLDRGACQSAASERFAAETMVRRHRELYASVLARRPR
jgi:glycosyltransferase involved in cell wall biosynthesis